MYAQTEMMVIAQSVRAPERKSLVVGSNPTHTNFLFFLLKSFSSEYHMRIPSIHFADHVITCARFRLRQIWRLITAMAKMKREH